jgi:hypothetical protein
MFIKLTVLGDEHSDPKEMAERHTQANQAQVLLPTDRIKSITLAFPGALKGLALVNVKGAPSIYVRETLEEIQEQLAGVTVSAEPPGETIESLKTKLALLSASTAELMTFAAQQSATAETGKYIFGMLARARHHHARAQSALGNTPEQP